MSANSLDDVQEVFAKRYKEKFGKVLPSDAAFAYDDVMVISKALKPCISDSGEIDNTCFIKEMLKTNYNGIAGNLSFDKDGVSQRDGILIKIKDGEWVEIK